MNRKTIEKGLQMQNAEDSETETLDADDVASKEKLQQSESSAENEVSKLNVKPEPQELTHQEKCSGQNIPIQDLLQKSEASGTSHQECMELTKEKKLKQETNVTVQQKLDDPERSLLIPEKDSLQATQLEMNEKTHQESGLFAVDKPLESERNIKEQQIVESRPRKISINTENDINVTLQQNSDKIVDRRQLEGEIAQQKNNETLEKLLAMILKSYQLYKISDCEEKLRERGSEERKEVSRNRTETGAIEDESTIRAQLLRELVANFFRQSSKQLEGNAAQQQKNETLIKLQAVSLKSNQLSKISDCEVKLRERGSEERKEVSRTRTETGTIEDELSIRAQLLRELVANFFRQSSKQLQRNAAHQQKNETLTKILAMILKSYQLCKISDCEVKLRERISEERKEVSRTRAETGAIEDESPIRADLLRELVANFFRQSNQINKSQTDISPSFINLRKRESQQLAKTVNSEESKYNRDICQQQLGVHATESREEYVEGILARPQESIVHKNSEDYITPHPLHPPNKLKASSQHHVKQKDNTNGTCLLAPSQPLQETESAPHTSTHKCLPDSSLDQLGSVAVAKTIRISRKNASSSDSPTRTYLPTRSRQQVEPVPVTTFQGHVTPGFFQETVSISETSIQEQNVSYSFSPEPQNHELSVHLTEEPLDISVATNDPIQQNKGILSSPLPFLPTGIQDFTQRICERRSPIDRPSVYRYLQDILFYTLLVIGLVAVVLFLLVINILDNKINNSYSNVTSQLTTFHANMNMSVTDFNAKTSNLMVNLDEDITLVYDFTVNVTTPTEDLDYDITLMSDFAINATTAAEDLDDDSTLENDFAISITFPAEDFDVDITPANAFTVDITTSAEELDDDITPVNDSDISVTPLLRKTSSSTL